MHHGRLALLHRVDPFTGVGDADLSLLRPVDRTGEVAMIDFTPMVPLYVKGS
jgi:hypothetical protein